LPARYAIFVAQLGRKFRRFSLTLQRYEKFKALPNFSAKKARKKSMLLGELTESATVATVATVLFKPIPPQIYTYIYIYIYIYINIKFIFDFWGRLILTVATVATVAKQP